MAASPPSLSARVERVIDLAHVEKVYSSGLRGKVHALRGIRMQVNRGEIFGLLGPNGAGKSTLVKILMTVIRATRAEGTMLGRPVGDKSVLAQVGYLPEHHRFPDYLTGAQVLDFAGAMAGTPRHERRARAGALLELVGMSAWANRRIKSYSKGMRQRVGIAQSLINDPDLVVLDEPTDGVDPVGRRDIRNILIQLRDRGHTVFLNSHLLSELELVCDRVAILVQGTVSSQGTIDELTTGRQAFEIELAAEEGSLAIDSVHAHFRAALPAAIANQPTPTEHVSNGMAKRVAWETQLATGERVEIDHQILRVCTADARAIQPIIDDLRARGAVIRAVRPIRPSLEDLFMQAVTDPNTGLALAPGAAANGKERR